ncbi:MAG: hypothetical protein ABIH76_06840 [Candidatus Bathyarchaeota archaeon]
MTISNPSEPLEDFGQEATRLIDVGKERGIILRLMGACAIMLHSPKYGYLYADMGRELSDLDLLTYSKFRGKLQKFFAGDAHVGSLQPDLYSKSGGMGYVPDKWFPWQALFMSRHRYLDVKRNRAIDVFIDKLEFCHSIDFKNRLEIDYPTIPLTDMLMTKLQIVQLTEKDMKDVTILFTEHDISDKDEKEFVNSKYLAKRFSDDWGYYHTATGNIKKVLNFIPHFPNLDQNLAQTVSSKLNKLLEIIENEPKSGKWNKRAKVGTSKMWYNKIE